MALGATPPQNRRAVVLAVRFCSFCRAALRPNIFHSPARMNETGGPESASSGRVKPNCDGIVTRRRAPAPLNRPRSRSLHVSQPAFRLAP